MNTSNNNYIEGWVIRFGVVVFWVLYWFLNVVDKFIGSPVFLWVGKDRFAQFVKYFSSIGIENQNVASGFLIFVTTAEIVAFILVTAALWNLVVKNYRKAHIFFFWGTFAGLAIFSIFSIGDQIFGDRRELLEHTIYWIALIVSWGAYTYYPKDRGLRT